MGIQEFLTGLLTICVVNIVLSGDNAVVIALASRNLPAKQRKLAIFWGSAGAIILRVVLTFIALLLLKIPYLQTVGGLLLIWIGIKLLVDKESGDEMEASSSMMTAIKTIVVADLIMSLDNILAVAAASKGNYTLLILGIAISIPIIVIGSHLLVWLMNKFPPFVYIGAGLIAWTAGKMINGDKKIAPLIYNFDHEKLAELYKVNVADLSSINIPHSVLNVPESLEWVFPAIITVYVCVYGWEVKNRRKAAKLPENSVAE